MFVLFIYLFLYDKQYWPSLDVKSEPLIHRICRKSISALCLRVIVLLPSVVCTREAK